MPITTEHEEKIEDLHRKGERKNEKKKRERKKKKKACASPGRIKSTEMFRNGLGPKESLEKPLLRFLIYISYFL